MGWKPSRSSGIVFDRHMAKSNKYRSLILEMIENNNHLRFENLNAFSKYVYLYWLNENMAHNALCGRTGSKNLDRYSLECCCIYASVLNMFKRNKDKVYKPLQQYLIN